MKMTPRINILLSLLHARRMVVHWRAKVWEWTARSPTPDVRCTNWPAIAEHNAREWECEAEERAARYVALALESDEIPSL